ncbi:MAG TPA: DUF3301 domain-containing protein [Motiliproteus sp.]
MYLALSDLAWLTFIGLLVLLWWRGRGIKDAAFRATRRHCEQLQLQLLDDSLVLCAWRFRCGRSGVPQLQRRYRFEFSATGDERYSGYTVLQGRRILRIEIPPYRCEE